MRFYIDCLSIFIKTVVYVKWYKYMYQVYQIIMRTETSRFSNIIMTCELLERFFFSFFCELFQIFSFPDLFSISFTILEFMLVHAFLRHIFIKVIIMCTETAEFSDM